MTQPNSWRFNQSYEERKQAYKRDVCHSHRLPPLPHRTGAARKQKSLTVLPTPNWNCPSTPPNSSREEDCCELLKNQCFINDSDSNSPTSSGDMKLIKEYEYDSDDDDDEATLCPVGTLQSQQERKYLEKNEPLKPSDPPSLNTPYYRTAYNPLTQRSGASVTVTKSNDSIPSSESSQKLEDFMINGNNVYKPSFGYIPPTIPPKYRPLHQSKSSYVPSDEKLKEKEGIGHDSCPELHRNY